MPPNICEDACKTAKEMGLVVSCGLNYRKNLWSKSEAKNTMEKFLKYVDVLIANEEDAAAASCLKQTVELDINLSKCEDVLALVNGDGSDRVKR